MTLSLGFIKQYVDLDNFVDTGWGSNNDRKLYTRYVFKLSGSAVSWESSNKQTKNENNDNSI